MLLILQKLFTFYRTSYPNKNGNCTEPSHVYLADVFVIVSHLHSNLIFAYKAGVLPLGFSILPWRQILD